ncbi:hypothetical protein ANANG_G00306460 [Anguilla anguilla]|uniref:Uncharacterized protein n=1 Tax=Anguilla anguilla TaxID=7936 RepID=A0A9D3LJZ5_ANGAN|nr:hypothetical protein ANANG_G00306460 [Anguilla anguilla]
MERIKRRIFPSVDRRWVFLGSRCTQARPQLVKKQACRLPAGPRLRLIAPPLFCFLKEYLMCMEAHRKTGQEMFERLLKNHVQTQRSENDAVASRWQRVEEELLRERGLFGPGPGVFLKQGWVQDAAEGPSRMRPRIRRKAPRRSKKFPVSTPGLYGKWNFIEENRGVAESSDTDSEPKILCEAGQEVQENGLDCDQLTFFPSLSESSPLSDDFSQQCTETQLILQELGPAEQVKGKLCVVIVSGHVVEEGVLLFGTAHFNTTLSV